MNVLYGNISLTKGVQVTDLQLSSDLKAYFTGPRFGITGIRERLGISKGALMMADIEPLGRSTNELAELTYCFAKGGVDLMIDEHLITDQSWSPFRECVHACCKAVERANAKTGRKSCYVPNITSSVEEMMLRAN
ncbi:MAG: RuBisCO large subunit C-terminal-like domain-containing protein [SAR324 cluster bacterium]|nr:RuBisCO large subunit C-terminal-like domain-containing protein [SAR324 cluster bacterium]